MTEMDLEFTAEETAFRDEVRAFLAAQLPRCPTRCCAASR